MVRPSSSFDALQPNRWKGPQPLSRWLPAWRAWYALRRHWRRVRVSRGMTALFGPQYPRSRDLIEIDITYVCNLACLNCNRSVVHARDKTSMSVDRIREFVEESVHRNKRWRRIRVLGGEPTLHPQFAEIIDELTRYHEFAPECIIEVVTNGHGPKVQAAIAKLPSSVWVENSYKEGEVQPAFRPFSDAPTDHAQYRHADFSNGCAIARDCGMGLTPSGYYPCAVAGGIDRVAALGLGRSTLPDDGDDMLDALERLCASCGRFKDGHHVPTALREPLTEEIVSPTWERLYAAYRQRRDHARRSRG